MRLPSPQMDQLTERQQELAARIAGKRGQVRGPFLVWLQSPELCDRVEALGAFVRFDCSLSEKLREFSILITSRFFDAQHSWNAHVDKAVAAGMSMDTLRAIAEHRTPEFEADDERIFYKFCMEVLKEHFVSDETFTEAQKQFGNQGLVDIIGCLGNFSMLAMCLNTFQVDLDPNRSPPFPEIRGFARIAPRPSAAT
jgi:4-carboxymuconolactone decarboxylase